MMPGSVQRGLAISIVAGLILPQAFAPFGYWPVAIVSLAGLFFALLGATPRRAFVIALAYGLVSFLGGTYWTFISVTVFYGAPMALGVAATGGLTLALTLFFAVAIAIAARFLPMTGQLALLVVFPAV